VIEGRPLVPMPLARGSHGAVVAPHHLATEAGLAILRAGGTAVDAAIATNAVLAVVMPSSCGIGGDAFWLTWDAATGRQAARNGSGRAGSRADAAFLRASGLTTLPKRGPLSITVPGAVRSWGDAHREGGRLSRDAVLAPAIELARNGFPAWDEFIGAVERTASIVAGALEPSVRDGFLAVYRPHGRTWRPGERVRLPGLAATLETLAREGFDAFYDGDLGERQARFLEDVGAFVTRDDLARHTSTVTEPIAIDYRGVRVTTHPPNSSGVVALELLSILARFEPPPPTAFGPSGVTDPAWIHLGIEAAKLAMADRDATLTDPAFEPVPVERLLDPAYAAELAARIDRSRASVPPPAANPPGGGTIYLAAMDAAGNAVSLIESNYLGFGSGVVETRRTRTASNPASGPCTRCSPACCSGTASPVPGSSPARWAATRSRRSTPSSSPPSSMVAWTSRPPSAPPAGSSSPRITSCRRWKCAWSRVTSRVSPRRCGSSAIR